MTRVKLRRGFEWLMEWIVILLLVTLAAIVLLGIGYRTFGHPLSWYDEVASVLLAWLTYYGAALAALKRAHISFPGLVRGMRRGKRIALVLFAELCVIAFFGLLAFYGYEVLHLLAGDTLVSVPIPVELTQSLIPIGAGLYVIAELLILPDVLRQAAGIQVEQKLPEAHAGPGVDPRGKGDVR